MGLPSFNISGTLAKSSSSSYVYTTSGASSATSDLADEDDTYYKWKLSKATSTTSGSATLSAIYEDQESIILPEYVVYNDTQYFVTKVSLDGDDYEDVTLIDTSAADSTLKTVTFTDFANVTSFTGGNWPKATKVDLTGSYIPETIVINQKATSVNVGDIVLISG